MRKTKTVSASISEEFYRIAEERGISWTDAMRIGLAIMFAERGIKEYLTELNFERIRSIFYEMQEQTTKKNEQTIPS